MIVSLKTEPYPFENRTALVGGASRGIGRACAELLAARGARVILLARDEKTLSQVAESLETPLGQKHLILPCDLSEENSREKALGVLREQAPPVSIFINNTGGPQAGPLSEATPDTLRRAFDHHLVSTQNLLSILIPGMKTAGYGRIINILSTSVRVPIPGLGVSNTIRSAMAGYAKTLCSELGPDGITVNNVLPGYTATERLESLLSATAKKLSISEAQVQERWKASVPLGRFAEAKEVAAAAVFLASPEAAYITGQSLAVDGGRIGAI